jgi:hypothetical protein
MGYALQSLLKIRAMREDRAAGELAAARSRAEIARRELAEREADLAEYEKTKEERRDRIFDSVIGRPVQREQIDIAREGVARIDEEGILKADNVKRAEENLAKRDAETECAKTAFYTAARNRMKIGEHRSFWEEEQKKEQEYIAEAELEDFTGRKKDDD